MASLKLIAIIIFFAAIVTGKYVHVIWAMILWEVAGGFAGSTTLWISDFGKDDHDS